MFGAFQRACSIHAVATSIACICLIAGASLAATSAKANPTNAKEMVLAATFAGGATSAMGADSTFPKPLESNQGSVDSAVNLQVASTEIASIPVQKRASLVWLLMAAILGFGVVARRSSSDQGN